MSLIPDSPDNAKNRLYFYVRCVVCNNILSVYQEGNLVFVYPCQGCGTKQNRRKDHE